MLVLRDISNPHATSRLLSNNVFRRYFLLCFFLFSTKMSRSFPELFLAVNHAHTDAVSQTHTQLGTFNLLIIGPNKFTFTGTTGRKIIGMGSEAQWATAHCLLTPSVCLLCMYPCVHLHHSVHLHACALCFSVCGFQGSYEADSFQSTS